MSTASVPSSTPPVFPRAALVFFVLVISGSLVLAVLGSAGKVGSNSADAVYNAEVQASRTIRFEELASGELAIIDHDSGQQITLLPPGNEGFIRGVLRGIARERMQHSVAMSSPFTLTRWADGQLALDDLATQRRLRLNGFGVDNERAFSRLLTD